MKGVETFDLDPVLLWPDCPTELKRGLLHQKLANHFFYDYY